jgi:hypothetical protein
VSDRGQFHCFFVEWEESDNDDWRNQTILIVTTSGEHRLQRAIPFVVCFDYQPYSMTAVCLSYSLVPRPRLGRIRPCRHAIRIKMPPFSLARHLDQRLLLRGQRRNSRPNSHGSLNLASLQAVRVASISAAPLCAQDASALRRSTIIHRQFRRHTSRALEIGDPRLASPNPFGISFPGYDENAALPSIYRTLGSANESCLEGASVVVPSWVCRTMRSCLLSS